MPLPDYMEKIESELAEERRAIVDSLVKLAEKNNLLPETLFRAVAYIDRYLSPEHRVRITTRRRLHRLRLLGVSSLLIASKYEEVDHVTVDDLARIIPGSTFTSQEVMDMEVDILKKLEFKMGSPTLHTFLSELNEIVAQEEKEEPMNLHFQFMASYLAELSLLDHRLCSNFSASLVAASSMFLSRFIIKPDAHPWSGSLQRHSGYKPVELKDCVLIIHDLHLRGNDLESVRDKYNKDEFKCVAAMQSPAKIPLQFFEDAAETNVTTSIVPAQGPISCTYLKWNR